MERKITITLSEYKAVALEMALDGKGTSIQQEMQNMVSKLYDRHVPQGARDLAEKLDVMYAGDSGQIPLAQR